jgi:hypothetical protein
MYTPTSHSQLVKEMNFIFRNFPKCRIDFCETSPNFHGVCVCRGAYSSKPSSSRTFPIENHMENADRCGSTLIQHHPISVGRVESL